jgi:catechol 2,3-dioxygenase-like lactoylglutathione lyase family enzyme
MSMSHSSILSPGRRIDHVVLPVADLETARARHAALGFVVAPVGVHPFGTRNCCVHFADGSFLEPLAVADENEAQSAIAGGNVFIARDRVYRDRIAIEGFSAVVLQTDDARADHEQFVHAGISAGEILDFSRPTADLSGRTAVASFRLAFANPPDEEDGYIFTCQRIGVPAIDRSALTRHANGVTGIARVIAVARQPDAVRAWADGIVMPQVAEIIDPDAAADRLGFIMSDRSMVQFAGIHLSTPSLAIVADLLRSTGIGYSETKEGALHVPPAPGQGAHLIFEEP